MLTEYWWLLASVVSILAIYYFWGRNLGSGPPKVKVVELSKTEPKTATMDE
jgi:hypothetical protein